MNSTRPTPPLPEKARRHFPLLCLLAVVAALAALAFSAPVEAQEGAGYEYVDLIVNYEYDNHQVAYSVRNLGTATATGVTVSFLLEDLQTNTILPITGKETVDNTNQRFTWEVGTVLPGETSSDLKFSTVNHSGHTTANRIGSTTATVSSDQQEPGLFLANNVAKVYSYPSDSAGLALHMRDGLLALLLSVDDLRPDVGGNVIFGLSAHRLGPGYAGRNIDLIGEIEIKVELSDGLKFKDGWTPTTADKFTIAEGRQSATWTPEAVDDSSRTTRPKKREISIQTQLTSGEGQGLEDIPWEERCITAWVADSIPPPSPDYVMGSSSSAWATIRRSCLGTVK